MMTTNLIVFAAVFAGFSTISAISGDDTKTPIYILGLYPMTGAWDGGVSFLPATQMALEHINANQSLLAEYELILVNRDTGVSLILQKLKNSQQQQNTCRKSSDSYAVCKHPPNVQSFLVNNQR